MPVGHILVCFFFGVKVIRYIFAGKSTFLAVFDDDAVDVDLQQGYAHTRV